MLLYIDVGDRADDGKKIAEPERLFSWRWHPYAAEPGVDYSAERATLVVFELEEVAGGTRLRVVESGFDDVPLARRAQAYRMNGEGWTLQLGAIERHDQRVEIQLGTQVPLLDALAGLGIRLHAFDAGVHGRPIPEMVFEATDGRRVLALAEDELPTPGAAVPRGYRW